MTMNKRILTLVLALVMVLSLAAGAFAAPAQNAKVQWLVDKGIIEGRLQDDGKTKDLELDKTITREEVAKIVIYYRGSESLARALAGTKGIFTDVDADRWSNGFINAAQVEKLVEGYPDKTFQPAGDITNAEVAAILVRMNKKWTAADEKNAEWPVSYIKAAKDFGILKGVDIKDFNAKAIREDVFEMMYNAFDGKYQAPVANDRLGVVSRVWANEIELNGKDTYTVEKGTVVINSKHFSTMDISKLYGALVRIVVDGENNVSHIVKLGDAGLKEVVADMIMFDGIAAKGKVNNATIEAVSNKGFTANDVKYVVDGNTRIFVSDIVNHNFFETSKLDKAIDFKNAAHTTGVYFVYDTTKVAGKNYVRAIVFSSGKVSAGDEVNYRVVGQMRNNFMLTVEDVFAKDFDVNFAKYNKAFPYGYNLDNKDVAGFVLNDDKEVKSFTKYIDHSEDPVYKVEDREDFLLVKDGNVKFVTNYIELKDEFGAKQQFDLDPKTDIFTHTAASGKNVDFHVQVHYKDDSTIDIISIVDKKLEGELPAGKGELCFNVKDVQTDMGANKAYVTIDRNVYELTRAGGSSLVLAGGPYLVLKDGTKVPLTENMELCGKVSKNRDGLFLVDLEKSIKQLQEEATKALEEAQRTIDALPKEITDGNLAGAKAALKAAEEANAKAEAAGMSDKQIDVADLKAKVEAFEQEKLVKEVADAVAKVTLDKGLNEAQVREGIEKALAKQNPSIKGYESVKIDQIVETEDGYKVTITAVNGKAVDAPIEKTVKFNS